MTDEYIDRLHGRVEDTTDIVVNWLFSLKCREDEKMISTAIWLIGYYQGRIHGIDMQQSSVTIEQKPFDLSKVDWEKIAKEMNK